MEEQKTEYWINPGSFWAIPVEENQLPLLHTSILKTTEDLGMNTSKIIGFRFMQKYDGRSTKESENHSLIGGFKGDLDLKTKGYIRLESTYFFPIPKTLLDEVVICPFKLNLFKLLEEARNQYVTKIHLHAFKGKTDKLAKLREIYLGFVFDKNHRFERLYESETQWNKEDFWPSSLEEGLANVENLLDEQALLKKAEIIKNFEIAKKELSKEDNLTLESMITYLPKIIGEMKEFIEN